MILATSSGGVGDSLIVGLKLLQRFDGSTVHWSHFERHKCHFHALKDVMRLFRRDAWSADVCIIDGPYEVAVRAAGAEAILPPKDQRGQTGIFLSSSLRGIEEPYLPDDVIAKVDDACMPLTADICIQMHAGRMGDDTKRGVHPEVVRQMASAFPDLTVTVVGPLRVEVDGAGNNLTGATGSILEAFKAINRCRLFVGQDGALAYYAMMTGKPTVVCYHDQSLLDNYWHEAWLAHALPLCQGSLLRALSPRMMGEVERMVGKGR